MTSVNTLTTGLWTKRCVHYFPLLSVTTGELFSQLQLSTFLRHSPTNPSHRRPVSRFLLFVLCQYLYFCTTFVLVKSLWIQHMWRSFRSVNKTCVQFTTQDLTFPWPGVPLTVRTGFRRSILHILFLTTERWFRVLVNDITETRRGRQTEREREKREREN